MSPCPARYGTDQIQTRMTGKRRRSPGNLPSGYMTYMECRVVMLTDRARDAAGSNGLGKVREILV